MSILSDHKILISQKNFSEEAIEDFNYKGHNFNHIAELHNMAIFNKMDMSY